MPYLLRCKITFKGRKRSVSAQNHKQIVFLVIENVKAFTTMEYRPQLITFLLLFCSTL